MYVFRLDRPWLGLPFPLEGFLVQNPKQIEVLGSTATMCLSMCRAATRRSARSMAHPRQHERQRTVVRHVDSATLHEELPHAREAHAQASHAGRQDPQRVRAGQRLSVEDAQRGGAGGESRKAQCRCLFLGDQPAQARRLRIQPCHPLQPARRRLRSAHGIHRGRAGQSRHRRSVMDVGKTEIDETLLAKPEALTEAETGQVRKHVENSLRIIEEAGIHHADVREMVLTHHERHDGSGYPDRLMRNQIPLFGRIAGLIDSCDAMTSTRVFRKAASAHHALQQLYRHGDQLFQREVVEQLMQCLSVYPTGSLVELNSGEVAIVMAQNHARRLRPRVMLLMTADKVLRENFIECDLMGQSEDQGVQREVVATLEPGLRPRSDRTLPGLMRMARGC
ncbi:MAG: DUF3391 domain-containing protein [Xanthomonadales bacterium]|nr:DUF3391 domain-containing protein [Xanthomonadales bacterium]